MRSVVPFREASGIATAEDLEIDRLCERLRQDIVSRNGVIVYQTLVRAWAPSCSGIWRNSKRSHGHVDPDSAYPALRCFAAARDADVLTRSTAMRLTNVFSFRLPRCSCSSACRAQCRKRRSDHRIGVVTLLSGPGAGPFGVPARNAAELTFEALNSGTAPTPYRTKGFGGNPIEMVLIDEAGPTTSVVTEYRNLLDRRHVDMVIGYVSSGSCLAVAPVAEELKTLTVLFDCGTPRLFEDATYRYVFRTASHATMDNIAAARYVKDTLPGVRSIAGINQNYAGARIPGGISRLQ